MKQNNALKMRFLLALMAILASVAGYAVQLSGSVSINATGTASTMVDAVPVALIDTDPLN